MISVIDYGLGNLGSVLNMIKKVGGQAKLVSTPEEILESSKLILPGVGSFDAGMRFLSDNGLAEAIKKVATDKSATLLGICLGMQLLLDNSEEGSIPGLGLIAGSVKKFDANRYDIRVPHMGWNTVKPVKESAIFNINDEEELRFYFVHSFYVDCTYREDIVSLTNYGHDFVSAFQQRNVIGVQFHPEKSHRFGMSLIKKFVELPC